MNVMAMKILHVMSEFPYPPTHGMRADILDRIRALVRLGCNIDVVAMRQKQIPEEQHVAAVRQLVNSLQFVERRPLRKCLATVIPTAVARNKALEEVPLCKPYDLVLAEDEDTIPIFGNPSLETRVRVLRVHDHKSSSMRAAARAEERFLRKQFCRLEALRFGPYSRSAYSRVDSLWFISQSECRKFMATQPSEAAKAEWLPPSVTFGDAPKRATLSKRVLFVGNFHISLNREALKWYLQGVHPLLTQDPEYELVVAGSTRGLASELEFPEALKREPRCRVYLNTGDLTSLYDQAAVFINPMQHGTGVKVKNIHAIERRVPVVTTSVGNDGSGFLDRQHVRVADRPRAFVDAIRELLNHPASGERMAARAHSYLTVRYDCVANVQRLLGNLISQNPQFSTDQRTASWRAGAAWSTSI
jgi:glycosyltransferase involved in cell wall biosynthesis